MSKLRVDTLDLLALGYGVRSHKTSEAAMYVVLERET